MILQIEHKGPLITECSLAGEQLRDGVTPGQGNGIRVSRNRWMVVYETRRYRGVDDDCSIVYQLRNGRPDGRVIKEGYLTRAFDGWDALGDGKTYWRQHGHPVLFGVPRGAWIGGKPVPSANVFVAKWRRHAVLIQTDPKYGPVLRKSQDSTLFERTQGVEWVQFRLNEREDDIEILRDPVPMRQRGCETGSAFCALERVQYMNQSMVQAIPFNADCTEWADCNHFDQGKKNAGLGVTQPGCIAALRYVWNPRSGLYEWVQTGAPITLGGGLFEGSLSRLGDSWIISARRMPDCGVAWLRTDDPFTRQADPVCPAVPATNSPVNSYVCADGKLRLFSGDPAASPHRNGRDPLYCWDVDPDGGFSCSNRREILDSVKSGLLDNKSVPRIDMCKLVPHGGGNTQYLIHRVRVKRVAFPYAGLSPITPKDMSRCGTYYATVTYDSKYPDQWTFGAAS
jgi:hypothetical protein